MSSDYNSLLINKNSEPLAKNSTDSKSGTALSRDFSNDSAVDVDQVRFKKQPLRQSSISSLSRREPLPNKPSSPIPSYENAIIPPVALSSKWETEPFQNIQEHYMQLKRIHENSPSQQIYDKPVLDILLGEDDEIDENPDFIIYYKMADYFIRPMGVFTGTIGTEFKSVIPYKNRRSCGEIGWLPFIVSDVFMLADYIYVTRTIDSLNSNLHNVLIEPQDTAQIFVLGESFRGFWFVQPSNIQLKGIISIGRDVEGILIEEKIRWNTIIDVLDGSLVVYIGDFKSIVLVPDTDCRMLFSLINEEDEAKSEMVEIVGTSLEYPYDDKPKDVFIDLIHSRSPSYAKYGKTNLVSQNESLLSLLRGHQRSKSRDLLPKASQRDLEGKSDDVSNDPVAFTSSIGQLFDHVPSDGTIKSLPYTLPRRMEDSNIQVPKLFPYTPEAEIRTNYTKTEMKGSGSEPTIKLLMDDSSKTSETVKTQDEQNQDFKPGKLAIESEGCSGLMNLFDSFEAYHLKRKLALRSLDFYKKKASNELSKSLKKSLDIKEVPEKSSDRKHVIDGNLLSPVIERSSSVLENSILDLQRKELTSKFISYPKESTEKFLNVASPKQRGKIESAKQKSKSLKSKRQTKSKKRLKSSSKSKKKSMKRSSKSSKRKEKSVKRSSPPSTKPKEKSGKRPSSSKPKDKSVKKQSPPPSKKQDKSAKRPSPPASQRKEKSVKRHSSSSKPQDKSVKQPSPPSTKPKDKSVNLTSPLGIKHKDELVKLLVPLGIKQKDESVKRSSPRTVMIQELSGKPGSPIIERSSSLLESSKDDPRKIEFTSKLISYPKESVEKLIKIVSPGQEKSVEQISKSYKSKRSIKSVKQSKSSKRPNRSTKRRSSRRSSKLKETSDKIGSPSSKPEVKSEKIRSPSPELSEKSTKRRSTRSSTSTKKQAKSVKRPSPISESKDKSVKRHRRRGSSSKPRDKSTKRRTSRIPSSKTPDKSTKRPTPRSPSSKSQDKSTKRRTSRIPSSKPRDKSTKRRTSRIPSSKTPDKSTKRRTPRSPSSKPRDKSAKRRTSGSPSSKPRDKSKKSRSKPGSSFKLGDKSTKSRSKRSSSYQLDDKSTKRRTPRSPSSKRKAKPSKQGIQSKPENTVMLPHSQAEKSTTDTPFEEKNDSTKAEGRMLRTSPFKTQKIDAEFFPVDQNKAKHSMELEGHQPLSDMGKGSEGSSEIRKVLIVKRRAGIKENASKTEKNNSPLKGKEKNFHKINDTSSDNIKSNSMKSIKSSSLNDVLKYVHTMKNKKEKKELLSQIIYDKRKELMQLRNSVKGLKKSIVEGKRSGEKINLCQWNQSNETKINHIYRNAKRFLNQCLQFLPLDLVGRIQQKLKIIQAEISEGFQNVDIIIFDELVLLFDEADVWLKNYAAQ